MTDINPNPALNVSVNVEENFDQFATRIYNESRPLLFENGESIVLEPGSKYCILALELSEIATSVQFSELFGRIRQLVKEAESLGVIPVGWLKGVSTLFNLSPPLVPERFSEDGAPIVITWSGEQRFLIKRETPEEME